MVLLQCFSWGRAMPSADHLLAFAAATLLFAYMPGPAVLYTIAQTLARGRRAGLMTALGIHVGGYVHVIAAALGLSAVFHAVPVLYTVLKIAGALYLTWLGIGLLWRALRPARPPAPDGDGIHAPARAVTGSRTARRAFLDAIVIEILNPKAALFFLAFLPQFTDPSASLPLWAQLGILGAIVNFSFTSADVVYAIVAGSIHTRLSRSTRAQRLIQGAGGALLIGLGARLALQK